MRKLLTAFLTGALMLGATSGIATAAAGPSGGTIWVAHGIPGVKVDVCVDGAEARSNFKYGHAFALEGVPAGTYTVKVRLAAPGDVHGSRGDLAEGRRGQRAQRDGGGPADRRRPRPEHLRERHQPQQR